MTEGINEPMSGAMIRDSITQKPDLEHLGLFDVRHVAELEEQLAARDKEIERLRAGRESPEECTLVAVHTGDAWHLAVEDRSGDEVAVLGWPKSWPETMSADQLKACGFEVV